MKKALLTVGLVAVLALPALAQKKDQERVVESAAVMDVD
jgi:hypothetical protein